MSDNADKNSAASRERRLERVKKLLNLSKSGNPNEAALAMNMAVRILQESGLTMEDVGISEIKSIKLKKVLSAGFNRVPNYETKFLRLMEKAFGIKVILSKDYGVKTYEFYGPGDRVDMGVYVCEVLVRQLSAARKQFEDMHDKALENANADDMLSAAMPRWWRRRALRRGRCGRRRAAWRIGVILRRESALGSPRRNASRKSSGPVSRPLGRRR